MEILQCDGCLDSLDSGPIAGLESCRCCYVRRDHLRSRHRLSVTLEGLETLRDGLWLL